MSSAMDPTYLALTKPIPDRLNLSNISSQPPCLPCEHCRLFIPDRAEATTSGRISIPYHRVDLYPDFPGLKASAKAGCDLCRLIRKAIRSSWAARPMDDRSGNALSDREPMYYELFDTLWDRKVRIYNARFTFDSFPIEHVEAKRETESDAGGLRRPGPSRTMPVILAEQRPKAAGETGFANSAELEATIAELRMGGSVTYLNLD